ncbi:MAG: IS30 family transposase [Proteobacteria bacterium]|nr:MAG: IS30 family transposase [Pseudomonadota bacterium]
MRPYRRVSYEQRCQISALLETKIPIIEVAKTLGLHRSSVYREINRNWLSEERPTARRAHLKARFRRVHCGPTKVFADRRKRTLLKRYLERDLSPEQIAGRFRLASHQTIYDYLRASSSPLQRCLRRFGRSRGRGRRGRRKPIPRPSWKNPIAERPRVVEDRNESGHWERDTMYVANRKMLLVCVERKSRFIRIQRLKRIEPRSTYHQTIKMMQISRKKPRSITNDNGAEFMGETNARVPIYFCNPRSPQERGTIENLIGLVRQYFKRNTNLRTITDKKLRSIEYRLNHRPRKCLNFRTPHEVMFA